MKRKSNTGCLTPIIALLLVFGLLGSCSSDKDSEPSPSDHIDSSTIHESVHDNSTDLDESTFVNAQVSTGIASPAENNTLPEISIPAVEDTLEEKPATEEVPSESAPAAEAAPKEIPAAETTGAIVYITDTGTKYHYGTCRHLSKSKIEISLNDAIAQGYEPCGTCH